MLRLNNRWKISEEDAFKEYILIKEKKSNLTYMQRRVVVKFVEDLDIR